MSSLRFILVAFGLLCHLNFSAQSEVSKYSISGRIQYDDKTSGPGINVLLRNAADSALVKTAVTDDEGNFSMDDVMSGKYFLATQFIGNAPYSGEVFELNKNLAAETITIQNNETLTKEVNVVATKPLIERKHDKLIMNVENSISAAGNNALEILGKAPGILVDGNENISMRGRQGVIVMVDGRPVPVAGNDLANFLKSIQASEIEKIEFITNPSARYDAAGNAGIIDIKLKRDKRFGTNGGISLSGGHGLYHKANAGIRLNNRSKYFNIFGNYNYSNNEGLNELFLLRKFYSNDSMTGAYDQHNFMVFPMQTHSVRAGADYYLSKKTTLSVLGTFSDTGLDKIGENTSDVWNENSEVVSAFKTKSNSSEIWQNYTANFNVKHEFDSTGKTLTADVDYGNYNNNSLQNFTTNYFDPIGNPINIPNLLYGDIKGGLNIKSIKADYVNPIGETAKFEAGVKSSLVESDNEILFFDRTAEQNILDTTKSNHFIYQENINAAYFSADKQWKKWGLQVGLRGEQTIAKGTQLINGESFNRNYFQLFPSSVLSYKSNDNNDWALSYSRRIDRPGYNQLNPFKFFLDPTTYREGNPYLLPQLSDSYDLTHTWKQKISTSLTYTSTTQNITEVIYPDPNNLYVTVQTDKNLTRFQLFGIGFYAQLMPTKWWSSITSGNFYYSHYTGNLANTQLNRGATTANVNITNNFFLPKNFGAELTFNIRAREVYGYMLVEPIWFLSAGVSKSILNRKGMLKFSFSDMLFTNGPRAYSDFRDYKETFKVRRDTRVAMLTFTYNFGKGQPAQSSRRTGGAEDEKRRAANSGNG